MKRLNLSQTCLLEVSGELGASARAKLQEHIETYPAALLEFELVRNRFAMLRSLPTFDDQCDQFTREKIAQSIKTGIHQALRKRRAAASRRRWVRAGYALLSAGSGMAACLLIGASIYMVNLHIQQRQQRILDAEHSIEDVAKANLPDQSGSSYGKMATAISSLEKSNGIATTRSIGNMHMMQLLDALDQVASPAPPAQAPLDTASAGDSQD